MEYKPTCNERIKAVIKRHEEKKKNGTAHFIKINLGDTWSDVMKRHESEKMHSAK